MLYEILSGFADSLLSDVVSHRFRAAAVGVLMLLCGLFFLGFGFFQLYSFFVKPNATPWQAVLLLNLYVFVIFLGLLCMWFVKKALAELRGKIK
jgi:MFS family permease